MGEFHLEAVASGSGYAQVAGDRIYYNPVLLDRLISNPFKLKERKYPVDMSYGRDVTCVSTVHIPPDFETAELPKDVAMLGKDIAYRRISFAGGDSVLTMTRMTVTASVFRPEIYKKIRDMYDQIVATESEQIVFQRKPKATPAPDRIRTPVRLVQPAAVA